MLYHNFVPSDLDLEIWPTDYEKTLAITLETEEVKRSYFIYEIRCDKTLHTVP